MLSLRHLSEADHTQAAKLLSQVQEDLKALTRIVQRAPFTDRVMRVQKAVQERLIDPLRDVPGAETVPYPNVYYAISSGR